MRPDPDPLHFEEIKPLVNGATPMTLRTRFFIGVPRLVSWWRRLWRAVRRQP